MTSPNMEAVRAYRDLKGCSLQEAKAVVQKSERIEKLKRLRRQTHNPDNDPLDIIAEVISDMIAETEAA